MTNTKDRPTRDRAEHFDRLQTALEEGLRAINAARSPEEAEWLRFPVTSSRKKEFRRRFDGGAAAVCVAHRNPARNAA